jgi:membrane protease YdiL (CAAX protease family)
VLNEPAPVTPEPPTPFGRDSSRRQRLLVPAWLALTVLLLLLAFVLNRNFQHDRRSPVQNNSDLIEKERTAVAETKTAFSQVYDRRSLQAAAIPRDASEDGTGIAAYKPVPINNPTRNSAGLTPRASIHKSREAAKGIARLRNLDLTKRVGETLADAAIEDWRAIADSPAAPAGAWRRLGIALFLFNRPGGMPAFRHIAKLPARQPVPVKNAGALRSAQDRTRTLDAAGLPVAEETALWEALYGARGPRRNDVPSMRAKLARLRLGWFEDIAAAQLYYRAGMAAEAEQASRQAHRSADILAALLTVEGTIPIIGILLLIVTCVSWMARRLAGPVGRGPSQPSAVGPPSLDDYYAPPNLASPQAAPPILVPASSVPEVAFSYRTRMIAFVVYFASYLLISWPLQLIGPLTAHWSERAALRLDLVIDLLAYIPITAVTLYTLKRLAEAEQHRRLTWRETWSAIGFRTGGFGRSAMTAIAGYTMTVPLLLLASFVSAMLFKNFHTPSHPVELIILNTQDGFVRTMILLQACVGAPIVEELTFRGLLFKGLSERWGVGTAAVLSAAVFALAHNTLPGGFLTLWTLGVAFAMVCRRNGSIVPNILMHAIHNGFVTLLMYAIFSQ